MGEMKIVVAGCVAQQEGETLLRRVPEVDLVMGELSITKLLDTIQITRLEPCPHFEGWSARCSPACNFPARVHKPAGALKQTTPPPPFHRTPGPQWANKIDELLDRVDNGGTQVRNCTTRFVSSMCFDNGCMHVCLGAASQHS